MGQVRGYGLLRHFEERLQYLIGVTEPTTPTLCFKGLPERYLTVPDCGSEASGVRGA